MLDTTTETAEIQALEQLLGSSPNNLASWTRLLELYGRQLRRDGVITALSALVRLEPDQLAYRLRLGNVLDQRGEPGAAGRAFDVCIERLRPDAKLQSQLLTLFLVCAQRGPDKQATVARLDRLAAAVEQLNRRGSEQSVVIARCRVMLALRNRDGFLAAASDIDGRWPNNRKMVELVDLANRWRSAAFLDRGTEKVFVIGLSRTGTSSVHDALGILGYRSLHWLNHHTGAFPDELDYDLFDAFGDINITANFESLHGKYPDARFIWTQRPVDSWIHSISAHYLNFLGISHPRELLDLPYAQQFGGRLGEIHRSLYSSHESWRSAHAAHRQRVRSFFADVGHEALLEFSVTSGDGWEQLSRFLDRPQPDQQFPHSNIGPGRQE